MPTNKPRITFTLPHEMFTALEAYRHHNNMKNQTQAILSLLRVGLEASGEAKAPACSQEAMQIAAYYDTLDFYGQEAIRQLSTLAYQRCRNAEAEQTKKRPNRAP